MAKSIKIQVEMTEIISSVVTAPAKSVATATNAVLSCTITEITQSVTVTWKNGNGDDLSGSSPAALAEYTVVQGSYSQPNQLSTLTITPAGMAALQQTTTTFTCVVKSGEYSTYSPDVIVNTAELTKLTYGW